jgi:ABC-type transport system involved in multi-copper enzyme maturation permease subunit
MTALRRPRLAALRDIGTGIAAVGVKELRGRMRGKRAFVMLTIYLLIVAGFAWMVESFAEMTIANGMSSGISAAAEIGRQMFTGLLMLLTLVVLVLAPASTAGAISLEREKQTLDLLTTTPISSLAIVLGKLLSALSWVLLLLLASIPVSALVFAFGGVGPDDMVKGYVVLFGTALGYGALGLFVSALLKRTQAATVINLVLVIALTVGATIIFIFWSVFAGNSGVLPDGGVGNRPPEALLWLNPFVAEVDVICGTDTGFGASCQIIAAVTGNQQGFDQVGGQAFGVGRDSYWPRALAATAALATLLVILSVQLVSPTRRWHIRRPRRSTAGSTP